MSVSLGIDLGTSSVKVVAVDGQGSVVTRASRSYGLEHPHDSWSEIDAEVWWTQTRACLAEVAAQVGGNKVASIGVTGQMHSVVLLDGDLRPVRPVLMWNDVRTAHMVESARRRYREAGLDYLASVISTGSPALSLAWVAANEPRAWAAARTFVIGPDWIVLRLTGEVGTDWCEASTSSLFDLAAGRWSDEAVSLMGVGGLEPPRVHGACEVAGALLPDVAADLGLGVGVTVIRGTGDNPASAVATGCVLEEGSEVLSLGTSGVLMLRQGVFDPSRRGKLVLLSLVGEPPMTLVQGVVQSCCATLDWWCEGVLGLDCSARMTGQLGDGAMTGAEPLFYPHLAGEKTLYADPSLRGMFVGLGGADGRRELTLAVLEGLSFAVRQLVDAMGSAGRARTLRVVGGGSRSDAWMQLLADVLGRPVERRRGECGAGLGVALLAASVRELGPGATAGRILADVAARREFESGEPFLPRDGQARLHDARYASYLRMHDAFRLVADAAGKVGI